MAESVGQIILPGNYGLGSIRLGLWINSKMAEDDENIKRSVEEFHAHRAEIEALGVGPALFGPATEGDVGDDDGTWGEDDEYYLGTTI